MIGSITTKHGEAVLQDNGEWTAENHVYQMFLNVHYGPNTRNMVGGVGAILPFGHHAIASAARNFECEYTLANPPKPLAKGMIS